MINAMGSVRLIVGTVVLIIMGYFIFAWLIRSKIIPRYFIGKHRIAYDASNDILRITIIECLKPHRIYEIEYTEDDFDCAILTFWCLKWQSKKILKDLKKLSGLEVI